MDDSTLREWFTSSPTTSTNTAPKGKARSLSARELLSKLEGDERDELQRAMKARDFDAVRRIIAAHAELAEVRADSHRACLEAPNPMMKPRGWTGPTRKARAPTSHSRSNGGNDGRRAG